MQGSRSKIPTKKSNQAALRGGISFRRLSVKGREFKVHTLSEEFAVVLGSDLLWGKRAVPCL
jgi:hypothetical protein